MADWLDDPSLYAPPSKQRAGGQHEFDDPSLYQAPLGHVAHITPTAPPPSFMQQVGDTLTNLFDGGDPVSTRTLGDVVTGKKPDVSTFAGIGEAAKSLLQTPAETGQSLLRMGVGAARPAYAISAMVRSAFGHPTTTNDLQDADYKATDALTQPAVEMFTPDQSKMGTGSRVLGGVGNVLGSLPEILGAAPAFLANTAMQPGTQAIDQGKDLTTAEELAGTNLGVNAAGLKLPASALPLLEKAGINIASKGGQLATRMLTGGATQTAFGIGASEADKQILGHNGYQADADAINPLDPTSLIQSAVLGHAFGLQEHLTAPVGKALGDTGQTDHVDLQPMPATERFNRAAEALQRNAQVLGHPDSALPAEALARPETAPVAQTLPVPAEAPPTPTPAEPAGQSNFAQQAAAIMRQHAQERAALANPTTLPAQADRVQPAAEPAGSRPVAGDLGAEAPKRTDLPSLTDQASPIPPPRNTLDELASAQQALSAERAKPKQDQNPEQIAALTDQVQRAQAGAVEPVAETAPKPEPAEGDRLDLLRQKRADGTLSPPEAHELIGLMEADHKTARLAGSGMRLPGVRTMAAEADAVQPPHKAFVDLDNFKAVNDAIGHGAGDQVIGQTASLLAHAFPDAVFHRGGDEFVIHGATPEDLHAGIQRVRAELQSTPMEFTAADGRSVTLKGVGLSYGVGEHVDAAEAGLHADKQARLDAGARTERRHATGDSGSNAQRPTERVENPVEATAGSAGAREKVTTTTGIANDVVNAERAAKDKDALETTQKLTDESAHAEAKKRLADNPEAGKTLAQDLLNNPRAPSKVEDMVLALDRQRIETELRESTQQISDAIDRGDKEAETLGRMRQQVADDESEINDLASRAAGTESGRSLQGRKAAIAADFSLAQMLRTAKANKGSDLTIAERKLIEGHAKRISELEAKLAERDIPRGRRRAVALGDKKAAMDEFHRIAERLRKQTAENPRGHCLI